MSSVEVWGWFLKWAQTKAQREARSTIKIVNMGLDAKNSAELNTFRFAVETTDILAVYDASIFH
jgi:hypothetical protein